MTRSAVFVGAWVLTLGLSACDAATTPDVSAPRAVHVVDSLIAQPAERTMRLWSASCALCHVDGNGGAPRVGNADEWLPRLAQGGDTLLEHAIEGLANMPPLGYCMACERDDFVAMIEFMTVNVASSATTGAAP